MSDDPLDKYQPESLEGLEKLQNDFPVYALIASASIPLLLTPLSAAIVSVLLGGVAMKFAGMVNDRHERRAQILWSNTVQSVQRRITILEEWQREMLADHNPVDEDYDFADRVVQQAIREPLEEKRRLYAQLLANAIALPLSGYDHNIETLRIVDALQVIDIEILRLFVPLMENTLTDLPPILSSEGLYEDLSEDAYENFSERISELEGLRLLTSRERLAGRYEQHGESEWILTEKGMRFIEDLLDPT